MLDKDRNYLVNFSTWRNLDWFLLALIITLFFTGILMLYSAGGGSFSPWAASQLKRFIVFLPVMFIALSLNITFYHKFAYIFYFIGLLMLLYANFAGFSAMGAQRWINIGFFNFQPSEYMKIALILALSKYFHNLHITKLKNVFFLLTPIMLTLVPVYLILKQPDLGTAVILLGGAVVIFFISGVNIWKFILAGLGALAAIPLIWSALKDYQKQRVLTFLNPENDPLGSGYNIIQSKIAIGSGGFLGQGYLSGSQSQLNFLPERETDFIFTMLAEEFGFLGSMLLVTVYSLIFFRSLIIAQNSVSQFGKYLATGLCFFIFSHFLINIAMVTGLIPVVGAPLPLISYGGTMLIITMFAFTLILNVDINRQVQVSRVSL